MEGAYLIRLRRSEISNLERLGSILKHGIQVERSKGSWDGVVTWSPTMRKFVKACKQLHPQVVSKYLIHNSAGGPVTKSSMDSMWRRVWAKVEKLENCPVHFTFHDQKLKVLQIIHTKREAINHLR